MTVLMSVLCVYSASTKDGLPPPIMCSWRRGWWPAVGDTAAPPTRLIATILEDNVAEVLTATPNDIVSALRIGEIFADQDFSMIDRTSWAVMERCGISEAVAFDIDFSVYRFGPNLSRAFTIHR